MIASKFTIYCMGCNAGMTSETHTKANQQCQAERLFCWWYGMICRQEFNDIKTIIWLCVATAGNILNTQLKDWVSYMQLTLITETYELLVKSFQKVRFIICKHSMHNCMFTWKTNFKF